MQARYLRAVKGSTRKDRIRNDAVKEELEIEPWTARRVWEAKQKKGMGKENVRK